MNWNKFVFKTRITLSRGKAWWDGTLQKSFSTPDWKRVEDDFFVVVAAPDIYDAERLAQIRAVEYGVQNGWENVSIWRVIGEPIDADADEEEELNAFAAKYDDM